MIVDRLRHQRATLHNLLLPRCTGEKMRKEAACGIPLQTMLREHNPRTSNWNLL